MIVLGGARIVVIDSFQSDNELDRYQKISENIVRYLIKESIGSYHNVFSDGSSTNTQKL